MKRMFALLVAATALCVGHAAADPVSDWNATAVSVMTKVPTLARSILNDLVYVHVAVYDAVNAIDGGNFAFAIAPTNAAPWASQDAAVAAAAHRVLVTFYPPQKAYLDSVYDAAIATLPNDSTTARGIAIGDTVAAQYLALRTGDGREGVVTYTWDTTNSVGVYQPTPPGAAQYQPVGTWTARMRTFVMDSASQLRPPEPPGVMSSVYVRDFDEVKKYGSRDSASTTPEQREIARFHTENPNLLLARNIRGIAGQIASTRVMTIAEFARYYAQLYLTIGDALITGFNSKYFYNYWRPVTAIRQADADGNPLTEQDTSWMPLVTTPTHPEYPAAHGCGMGGLAFGLQEFLGTSNLNFTLTSNAIGNTHFVATSNDLAAEVINARVWGGMHFRNSVEAGMAIARKVADVVARRFKPVITSPFWFIQRAPGLPPSVNPYVALSAVDEQICWGLNRGNDYIPSTNSNNQFIRTTNGGISWTTSTVQSATGLAGACIAAFDADTAWVGMYDPSNATSGGIFKTTDGGIAWNKQVTAFPGSGGRPVHLHFFDSNNGVAIGLPHGGNWEIYTTADGGAQWVLVPAGDIPPLSGEQGTGDYAVSGNSIWFGSWTSGDPFSLYRSKNRGLSWEVTRNMPAGVGFSVAFKDSLNGLAVNVFGVNAPSNRLAATTDGGVTWTMRNRPFVAPSTGAITYVPGTRGTYVITSWANIGLPVATAPGTAYTTDNGDNWTVADNIPHSKAAFASPSIVGALGMAT